MATQMLERGIRGMGMGGPSRFAGREAASRLLRREGGNINGSMAGSRYRDWLRQAKADLEWGKATLKSGFFPQACFIAQQTAEKALKALCYYRGFDLVKSHSVARIAEALEINGPLREAGQILDQYYIPSRYPDGLPEGAPLDYFTETQAREALEKAARFIEAVEAEVPGE